MAVDFGISVGSPNLAQPGSPASGITNGELDIYFAAIKAAGINYVRFDYNGLAGSSCDTYTGRAEAAGLKVLIILSPVGLSSVAFVTLCQNAVNFYKPGGTGGHAVIDYELGNETNRSDRFADGASYCAVAKPGGAAIKVLLPGAASRVVTQGNQPGPSGTALYPPRYIDEMLGACGGDFTWFDAIGTHPYGYWTNFTGTAAMSNSGGWPTMWDNSSGGLSSARSNIYGVMTFYGIQATKQIDATEWGGPSWSDGVKTSDWKQANFPNDHGMLESEVANLMSLGIADWKIRPGAGRLYIYSGRDRYPQTFAGTNYVANQEGHFGCLEYFDKTAKPSRAAVIAAIAAQPASGGGGGGPGAPSFPTTGLLDNFDRANGALGANWGLDPLNKGQAPAIASNVANDPSGTLAADALWTAANFGPDCEAYAVLSHLVATNDNYIFARFSGTNGNGYKVNLYNGSPVGTGSLVRLYKVTAGVHTQIGSWPISGIADGDSLGIQVIGTTISAWYKKGSAAWALIGSVTEATYTAAGKIGFYIEPGSTINNFSGGTYVPTGGTPGVGPGVAGFVREVHFSTIAGSGLATRALTVTGAPGAGSLVVLGMTFKAPLATAVAVTDNRGNTWNIDVPLENFANNTAFIASTTQNGGALQVGDVITVTLTGDVFAATIQETAWVEEFAGVASPALDQISKNDVASGLTGSTGNTPPTTQANEVAVALIIVGSVETTLVPATFTAFPTGAQLSAGRSAMAAYKVLSAIGAVSETFNWTAVADFSIAMVATYKAAGGVQGRGGGAITPAPDGGGALAWVRRKLRGRFSR